MALGNELGQLMARVPGTARRAVEDPVLTTHSGSTVAIGLAREAGLNLEEIGRGLAVLEEAGILIRPAITPLPGLPAANHAIDTTCRHQVVLEGQSEAMCQRGRLSSMRIDWIR
ncbi:hypothetical protein ACIBTP_39520 [Streptomyces avidinii]|uniref:hypothetical protein n=1 Tax=Streptomyces avidinii TaxID=1895 RepID=UPI0037BA1A6F